MYINSIASLSIATFCDIRGSSGNLLVIRNRSTFEKTGELVFGPIGGAVSVPMGTLQKVLDELSDFSPVTERETTPEEITDLRFTLESPALKESDVEKLMAALWRISTLVPDEYLSPLRELAEELVDEEAILQPSDLSEARISRGARLAKCYAMRNHTSPSAGNRLYGNIVSGVQLPQTAMDTLVDYSKAHPDTLRFVAPKDVQSGITAKTLAPATAVLAS